MSAPVRDPFADEVVTRTNITPLSAYEGRVPAGPATVQPPPLPPARPRFRSETRLTGALKDHVTAKLTLDSRWESTGAEDEPNDTIEDAIDANDPAKRAESLAEPTLAWEAGRWRRVARR